MYANPNAAEINHLVLAIERDTAELNKKRKSIIQDEQWRLGIKELEERIAANRKALDAKLTHLWG